jgi:uncharacterized membrane protein
MRMNESAAAADTSGTAKIIYILYLVGLVIPITALVGVIMAYVNQGEAPDWLKTHYRFQIRTFWIGLLYAFIGALTAWLIIGLFIILFYYIWIIIRCVKGMQSLDMKRAHPNPATWMFS